MNRYDIYICAVDIFEFHKDNGGTDDENSEQVNVLDVVVFLRKCMKKR